MSEVVSAPGDRVVIDKPESMNLLGLLMRSLLAANLANPSRARWVRGLEGDIEVQAGDMALTMRFHEDALTIVAGAPLNPIAKVKGTMGALLAVVTGKWHIVVLRFLCGKIRMGGNLLTLMKMLPLISAPKS
jgi:hypothetical protein